MFIQIILNIDSDQGSFCKFSRAIQYGHLYSLQSLSFFSRTSSVHCKTSDLSEDCDTSTSVSRCFGNLDNCFLSFY